MTSYTGKTLLRYLIYYIIVGFLVATTLYLAVPPDERDVANFFGGVAIWPLAIIVLFLEVANGFTEAIIGSIIIAITVVVIGLYERRVQRQQKQERQLLGEDMRPKKRLIICPVCQTYNIFPNQDPDWVMWLNPVGLIWIPFLFWRMITGQASVACANCGNTRHFKKVYLPIESSGDSFLVFEPSGKKLPAIYAVLDPFQQWFNKSPLVTVWMLRIFFSFVIFLLLYINWKIITDSSPNTLKEWFNQLWFPIVSIVSLWQMWNISTGFQKQLQKRGQ